MEKSVQPEGGAKRQFGGGTKWPGNAVFRRESPVEDRVVKQGRTGNRRGAKADPAGQFREIVVVGDAERGRQKQLPDKKDQDEKKESEINPGSGTGRRA